jgi:hypothetical protein
MQEAIQNAFLAAWWEYPALQHLTLDDYASHVRRLNATAPDLALHGSDLYLSLACGKHDQDAIRLLEQNHRTQLETHLVQAGFDEATRQDVFQQLLLHLCTGDSPRILKILSADFDVQRSEFESLAFLVRSELHLSLRRVLGAA